MREERKETLTHEQIKKDLLKADRGVDPMRSDSRFSLILLVATFGALGWFALHRRWILAICLSAVVLLLLGSIPDLQASKARKAAIENGDFTVLTDRLNSIEEDVPEASVDLGRAILSSSLSAANRIKHADHFHFSSSDWRVRRTQRFYEWSELYALSLKGLKNTSIPGDEFYVVVIGNDPHITYAYNKKLFTYVSEKGDPQ